MQIRLWGTAEENKDILNLLQQELQDKIKIVSSPYPSKNNATQRIYIEIDLENKNYRKNPETSDNFEVESPKFKEQAIFEEIEKRIN